MGNEKNDDDLDIEISETSEITGVTDDDMGVNADSASEINIDVNAPSRKGYKFKFSGTAGEYFKIWIVNISLTILTLGVYSAWAKVRKKKYLYRNTSLFGETFDYHAEPLKILKGRLLIGALGLLYLFGAKISPILSLVAGLAFLGLLPLVIVLGRLFNLRNTSYRNIRFDFERAYKKSYKTFFKGYLIAFFTLGLAFPYALYLQIKFMFNHSYFGRSQFEFTGEARPVFKYIYASALFNIVGFVTLLAFIFLFKKSALAAGLGIFFLYLSMLAGVAYSRTKHINYVFSNMSIDSIQLYADLDWSKMAEIYLTNILAIVFSFGLATPWAEIRTLRYRLECMRIVVDDESVIPNFIQGKASESGAVADAAADFWDVDLGF